MIAAGNAINLAVPNCTNRKAATILRTLRRYGAHVDHLATTFGAVIVHPSWLTWWSRVWVAIRLRLHNLSNDTVVPG